MNLRSAAIGRTAWWVVAGGLAILFLFPLVWSGWASLRIPGGLGLDHYERLFTVDNGVRPEHIINSVGVSGLTVGFTLIVSTLAGYAFGRFRFPGKEPLFLVTLAILMVPYATILISLFIMLSWLNLINSLVGLALVLTIFQLPFSVFMMRISFESVPDELEESALVDGCTTFGVLVRVMLHAVRPGMVTVALFAFMISWTEYFAPLILLSTNDKFTMIVVVANMRTATFGAIDYSALQAGVTLMAVPAVILFLFLQRHYVRGFMSGALRG